MSVLPLAMMAAFSCTAEMESLTGIGENQMHKITNTPENVCQESVLVLAVPGTTSQMLDEAFAGAATVERIFPDVPGTEAQASAFRLDRWYKATAVGCDIETLARKAAALSCVELVEYNAIAVKASDGKVYPYVPEAATKADGASFNDPSLKDQWHYINTGDKAVATSAYAGADINVKDAWTLTAGDPSIIVAVVDEGVKYNHPDLAANMWVNTKEVANGKDDDGNGYVDDIHGYNFRADGPVTWDKKNDSGHGTHIAGTVAAVNNNGKGVAGVAGGTGNNDGTRQRSWRWRCSDIRFR